MAIAFDINSRATSITTGAVISWSHTCTGSNLLLAVGITLYRGAGLVSPTTVTYGAQSLVQGDVRDSSEREEIWYLKNATAGTATITITFSASLSGGNDRAYGHAASFTGVANAVASYATGVVMSAPPSVNVVPTAASSLVVSNLMENQGNDLSGGKPLLSAGSGTPITMYKLWDGGIYTVAFGYVLGVPASSTSITWTTASGGPSCAMSALAFSPFVAPAAAAVEQRLAFGQEFGVTRETTVGGYN